MKAPFANRKNARRRAPNRPPPVAGATLFETEEPPVMEGDDPQFALLLDPMGKRFPRPWHVMALLFAFALALYVPSMSWSSFPGAPTRLLLDHMRLGEAPANSNMLWGWAVRMAARLPGNNAAAWLGLFSAACGALAAALMGGLMIRVGYMLRSEPRACSLLREAQARRLSGIVAGLFLACSIPFWIASTRSLPDAFHVLGLVAAAWTFSQYQFRGARRHLFLLGLLWGMGMTESETFIVLLPFALYLVIREMVRWNSFFRWTPQLAWWAGLMLGLGLYALHAFTLHRHGQPMQAYDSRWDALLEIWKGQADAIGAFRFTPGLVIILFLSLAPWLTLFAFSLRSPWFYESGQVAARLIFTAGLMVVLYNASFSPWNLMGMNVFLVTPYVVMAICMGYMAGEFWILGEVHGMIDIRPGQRILRHFSSALAAAIPFAVAAAAAFNWNDAQGRGGGVVHEAARDLVDSIDRPTILFAGGPMADALALAIRERRASVVLLNMSQAGSKTYLRRQARNFKEDSVRVPLEQGNFDLFFENLMSSEWGLRSVGFVDLPDAFREFGYAVPDGLLYRLQDQPLGKSQLEQVAQAQYRSWDRLAGLARNLPPRSNPSYAYQHMLCQMASRLANNFGVVLADRGAVGMAFEVFGTSTQLNPENASALLNQLAAATYLKHPEQSHLEALWERRMAELRSERWSLTSPYGHVWNPRQWLSRGWTWALSGAPPNAQASRLNPPLPPSEADQALNLLLEKAYMRWGQAMNNEAHYLSRIPEDPRGSLLALHRLALGRRDFELAEVYLSEAGEAGVAENELLFERAMGEAARGNREESVAILERLVSQTPGDPRVWTSLVLLADPASPLRALAVRTLRQHRDAGVVGRLVLGEQFLSRAQWQDAQAEMTRAIEIDARNKTAWEYMLKIARETRNAKLMEGAAEVLTSMDPTHASRYQSEGVRLYREGNLEGAERVFREGLGIHRDAALLNNLAHVLNRLGDRPEEALALADEALRREPGSASMLNTRAEILVSMGRLDEARRDVVDALRRGTRNVDPLLNLIVRHREFGEPRKAQALLRVAAALEPDMTPVQRARYQDLLRQQGDENAARSAVEVD
jgi:tetratricopeptide (TPR) repeat protein